MPKYHNFFRPVNFADMLVHALRFSKIILLIGIKNEIMAHHPQALSSHHFAAPDKSEWRYGNP
jgi:hypothetical protein